LGNSRKKTFVPDLIYVKNPKSPINLIFPTIRKFFYVYFIYENSKWECFFRRIKKPSRWFYSVREVPPDPQRSKTIVMFFNPSLIWRSLLVLVTLVAMVSPCCIGSRESKAPVGKGQAAHMESVDTRQEEDQSAKGVQEGYD